MRRHDFRPFRRLDKRIFMPIRGLKSLTLERNPWQCDCRLQDFWAWLMHNNLFNLPTACAAPTKLADVTWDRLDEKKLACPPEVSVPESMVTVSTGDNVRLGCLVSENPAAKMKWVRSGVIIANNSRNTEEKTENNANSGIGENDGGHQVRLVSTFW
jgi:hypothetical protein